MTRDNDQTVGDVGRRQAQARDVLLAAGGGAVYNEDEERQSLSVNQRTNLESETKQGGVKGAQPTTCPARKVSQVYLTCSEIPYQSRGQVVGGNHLHNNSRNTNFAIIMVRQFLSLTFLIPLLCHCHYCRKHYDLSLQEGYASY